MPDTNYSRWIKRAMDVAVASLLLLCTLPVLLIVAVLLFVANRGSIWFTQERPGKDQRLFRVVKFKTMNDRRDAGGQLLSDEQRLTAIGKLIRKLSIDELPQLANVIKGDMSLVGPRPLLTDYLPLYDETQRRRHEVRPGITGWAQVNGRNTLEWKRRFEYDVWYVDHVSFALDMKIVFLTLVKIFKAEGITSRTSATMEKFSGN
jgi:undecaprenyl phosphate N,N'-diacetylbacillosamine 1-phosphate transferase